MVHRLSDRLALLERIAIPIPQAQTTYIHVPAGPLQAGNDPLQRFIDVPHTFQFLSQCGFWIYRLCTFGLLWACWCLGRLGCSRGLWSDCRCGIGG